MSKTASLLFAAASVAWMIATAVSISSDAWLALLFGILTCLTIAAGFVYKTRKERSRSGR